MKIAKYRGLPATRWSPFQCTTPQGNRLAGMLCRERKKSGPLAGALQVTSVNSKPTSQTLMGMPEIPYPENVEVTSRKGQIRAVFTDKLDGTAVIFNTVKIDGKYELLPRTRGVPVIFNNEYRAWKDLLKSVADYDKILEACVQQQATLVFEMYGTKNAHSVTYEKSLGLALHTVLKNRRIMPRRVVELMGKYFCFELVPVIATCEAKPEAIASTAEAIIDKYEEQNDTDRGEFLREGLVLSLENASSAHLWKYKPPSMAEFHRINRRKTLPIALRHVFYKLLESEESITLERALDATIEEYGEIDDYAMFEKEYQTWLRNLSS